MQVSIKPHFPPQDEIHTSCYNRRQVESVYLHAADPLCTTARSNPISRRRLLGCPRWTLVWAYAIGESVQCTGIVFQDNRYSDAAGNVIEPP